MHPLDQVAEAAQLGRRVHRARDDVGRVEVAAERRRVDAGGEAADRLRSRACPRRAARRRARRRGGRADGARRRRARCRPRPAARRGRRTARAARRSRARPPSRARARRPRRRPPRRRARASATPPRSLCSPSTRLGTASPVSACARRSPSSRSRSARFRITSTPANPSRFARRKSCPSSALGSTSVITPGSRVTAVTGAPSRSAERQAASVSSSDRRLWRAELYGSRSSAIADSSSAIVPASPSGYQAPSSSNGHLAVAVELEEVRAEQDAAADRGPAAGRTRRRRRRSTPRTPGGGGPSPRRRSRRSRRRTAPRGRRGGSRAAVRGACARLIERDPRPRAASPRRRPR